MLDVLTFRNSAAEDGLELTPEEAKELLDQYDYLKNCIKEGCGKHHNFYNHLKNLTTEQKLDKIKELEKERGVKFSLKEMNETIKLLLQICELEGYV